MRTRSAPSSPVMDYYLPAHISFGLIGERAVVLDAMADRYYLLAGPEARLLAGVDGTAANPTRAARLADRGLLARGAGRAIVPVEASERTISALERQGSAAGVSAREVGRHRLEASLSLRFRGLSPTIQLWRRLRAKWVGPAGRSRLADSAGGLGDLARGFANARLYVPASRRCVPDSLALMRCLWRCGHDAELYFGVRLAPFAAHCWVQKDELLLSDPLDIVREFTPVFRL